MVDQYYMQTFSDDFKKSTFTLLDFYKVCKQREFPFFVVKIIDNPYEQHQRTETYFTYINVDEFKESLPSWLGRNYDYVNDRATEYYDIPGIDDGEFEVTGSNSYSSYHLHFQVCMNCVVVNFNFSILD